MNTNDEPLTRWYQEPYGWMVIGIPVGTIAACMLLIRIAMSNPDELVIDDYYKEGLAINRVIEREARANELGLSLENFQLGHAEYQFRLSAGDDTYTPLPEIQVLFAHATRAAGDQQTIARAVDKVSGIYRGSITALEPGPWYVEIATDDWRLVERVDIR